MKKPVDTIILANVILPVASDKPKILNQYAVVIKEGIILDIMPQNKLDKYYRAKTTHTLKTHCLMPGLVNAHTHSAMSLLRGFSDDVPLDTWLNDYIFPAEARFVDYDFVKIGSQLAIAEMLKSGTTCFNDMYFYPDATAEAVISSGIRAQLGMVVIQFPTNWASDSDDYINKGLAVYEHYKHQPHLSFNFAPHAPYTNDNQTLAKIAKLSQKYRLAIHTHINETKEEVENSFKTSGSSPLTRLQNLGVLSNKLLAVHMTQLTNAEIKLCQKFKLNIIHCPQSNMKLASGFCPVQQLQAHNINVALGTDGPASNNDLDMLAEMQTASLLAKATSADATALNAYEAIKMATINGAIALGLDKEIGSLEVGKSADIIAIDLNNLIHNPHHNIPSQIVYAKNQVSDVWVMGEMLLGKGQLTNFNTKALSQPVKNWQNKIADFYAKQR